MPDGNSGGGGAGSDEVSYAVLEQPAESGDVVYASADTPEPRPLSVSSNLYAVVDKKHGGAVSDEVVYADNLVIGTSGPQPDLEERVEYAAIATDGV